MSKKPNNTDKTELNGALKRCNRAFVGIAVFSGVINLLMLTGPLYMLQVYDRVLLSRSMSTLVALSILMAGLYVFMGFLELIRSRVLIRVGNQIEADLSERTFGIWMNRTDYSKTGAQIRPLDDLTTVKTFFSGPSLGAIFDMPWAPLFIAVIWMLHWTLGLTALIGAILIFIIAALNEFTTRKTLIEARQHLQQSRMIAEHSHRQSSALIAMGMSDNILKRWQMSHSHGASLHTTGSDRAGRYVASTKAFRMFLQSAILGLGCALAVVQIITPGTMIAGSIIMGRALAPIQMAIGQWKGFVNARQSYKRLTDFYEAAPSDNETLQLPDPKGHISVQQVTAAPPGSTKAVLANVSFELKPGQGLGVIGPSASGKSTLAQLLVGVWMPQRGAVRLDGATFDQWDRNLLGPHIGYLPQNIELLNGSIKDNISRFNADASDEDVVLAAQRAAVHEMILQMPKGYETLIGAGGTVLSGGQVQRIALARALYGDPAFVVLDEPNASLDSKGDAALTAAIAGCRQRGKTVIVMTHRPSAIDAVDMLLILKGGQVEEFGLKKDVLATLKNNNTRRVQNPAAPRSPVRESQT